MTNRRLWPTRVVIATALAVVVVLGLASGAHAAVPTQPTIKDAWVSGAGKVSVQWYASIDASGHAISYDIYRDVIPISAATIVSRSLAPVVTGFSGTTVQVNASATEVAQSYVWYYAVVAKDDQPTPNKSAPSLNMAPNLHGYRFDVNLIACTRCHSAHGVYKIPYTEKGSCYTCHGGTGFTAPMGAKSTFNTEASFYDTGTATPGSRHRNQYMTDTKQECAACHTPHRSPYYYNAAGVYDAASSYRRMLRIEYATSTYAYYSRNSVPAQANEFCFSCHGGTAVTWDGKTINASTAIGVVGGPTAYASAGGDHNYSGYAASAHGTGVIYSNDYDASAATTDNPAVQCEACHHNHASAADKLIDYRSSDTTVATKWAQANLCYGCHSAASTETSVNAAYTKPFAWNGRDAKAQFQKVSHHPVVARVGDPVAEPGATTQTTLTDFAGDTLTNTTAVAGGSGTSGAVELTSYGSLFSDNFEDGSIADWTATGDVSATQLWSSPNWSIQAGNGNTATDIAQSPVFSIAGRTNVTLSFAYQRALLDAAQTEFMYVDYSTDGGSSYNATPLWSIEGNGGTSNATVTGISLPAGTNRIRLRVTNADFGEYGRWDDIAISADPAYVNSGNIVSTAMPTGAGSVSSWTTVSYTVNQPVGSTIEVDVLDAADDTVLLSDVTSGQSLGTLTASSIKLRARLSGNAPIARVASDDFGDGSFDTAKWGNVYMGSTDPDAAASGPWSDTTDFASSWGSWTPTGTYWSIAAGYASWAPDQVAQEVGYFERTFDLTNITNPQLAFNMGTNSMDATEDYYRVQYSVNGGAWQTLVERTDGTDVTWPTAMGPYTLTGAAGSNNVAIRFTAALTDDSFTPEYVRYDDIVVSGTISQPATDLWPDETGGDLTLRAEGTGFGRTAAVPGTAITDEGEFTYIKPTAADWVDTQDFDAVVRVPSYNNLGASGWMKAGLMIRTGTTEANAYAANAAMVGLYVTDTNGVVFQSRTTAGGTASANAAGTDDAPVYLKLSRRGNVLTGYKSTDGATWTQVGSQTVTMDTFVLAGVCLSSSVNGTFSEATYDDFSITENTGASTVTPRLDDWTVTYEWIPMPTTGSLTCVNCHNVHYAGRGTAGTVWQMVRAALPSNTKTNYTGTPTQFCLECHDGSAPSAAVTNETTIVPYAVEFSAQASAPFFPGWNKTAAGATWSNSSHGNSTVPNMSPGCETCHDPHASDNKRLTALTAYYVGASPPGTHVDERRNNTVTYTEQNLCYGCHTNDRTPNCAGGACHGAAVDSLNVQTAFGLAYRHPVEVNGRHSDTETAAQLGSANRHSECADCHDPHAARSGLHTDTNSKSGEALRGATGIKPSAAWPANWTAVSSSGWTAERMTGEATDVEAYVCLKCHSSYSGQPFSVTSGSGTYTSTDLALEFNPSNQSEHNVLGQSVGMETVFTVGGTQYDWSKPADADFLITANGWTSNSQMTCTACHSNTTASAKGPHGSSAQWLIQPGYTTWTNTTALTGYSGIICAKCHTNLVNSNIVHSQHDSRGNEGGYCRFCHVKIPHGWKRPRLIGYTTDPAPYATISGGIVEIALKDYTDINSEGATGWGKEYCYAACSTGRHPDQTTAWP